MAKSKQTDKNNLKSAGLKGKKAAKPAPKPKAEKVAKPKAEKVERAPLTNAEDKALFLHHLPKIKLQKDKLATATADLRNLYKTAKADGFEKADFDLAAAIETAEKEAKTKAKIARQLQIAQFLDSDLGEQLDMFLEPARVPAADRAYKEGQSAAMQHLAAKPSYDPATEQHREYMRGYGEVQGKQLKAGIGKSALAKPEKAASPNASGGAPIASGMAMSRADYKLQQDLARQEEERGAGSDSAFRKKAASPS